jgi:hypothetical protein
MALVTQKSFEALDILTTEYVSLLNEKQALEAWGRPQLQAQYDLRIGSALLKKLKARLQVDSMKKKIKMAASFMNRQQKPDLTAIEVKAATELADAQAEIMQLEARIAHARQYIKYIEIPENAGELGRIYRQLAKLLHPAVNKNLTRQQELTWFLVSESFQNGDIGKLKALQMVYEKEIIEASAMQSGFDAEEMNTRMRSLKKNIRSLQGEIIDIRVDFPFSIEHQLSDPTWVKEECDRLIAEAGQLEQFEKELRGHYLEMVKTM